MTGDCVAKDRISEQQRRTVAYHEAGIPSLAWSATHVLFRRDHRATRTRRWLCGHVTREDAYIVTRKELYDQMVGLLRS